MSEKEYGEYLRQVRDMREEREAREWNYPNGYEIDDYRLPSWDIVTN